MLYKYIKWLILIAITFIVAMLILTLRREQGVWIIGFPNWYDSSVLDNPTAGYGAGQIRFKEVIISISAGGGLAVAGVLLQKTTRNRLAEVSILGIGSINIMFIFGYIMIFKDSVFVDGLASSLLPVVTLFASFLGTFIIWAMARSNNSNKNTFVIVGIGLQLLFEALSVVFVNPKKLTDAKLWNTIQNYTLGRVRPGENGADGIKWSILIIMSVIIIISILSIFFIRNKLDIYEISDELTKSLGIKREVLRITTFAIVALLAGCVAVILGAVGLLGILAPSIARRIFKNKTWVLVIASFLIGAALVMFAVWLSRVDDTFNIPAGMLTTAITTPYFIFMILKGEKYAGN